MFDGLGWMVNSDRESFDGLFGDEAKKAVISTLEEEGSGHGTVQYRLRDWLLSRQRFWGPQYQWFTVKNAELCPLDLRIYR